MQVVTGVTYIVDRTGRVANFSWAIPVLYTVDQNEPHLRTRIFTVWAARAVMKISITLLKCPSFESFFHIFISKNPHKIRISVHTKVVGYHKSEKNINFGFIVYLFGSKYLS